MSIAGINLSLSIGTLIPSPAPRFIMEALQQVQIMQTDQGPSGFQISFNADRTAGNRRDYALLESPLLKPQNRVLLTVTINGTPYVLMDGFITQQELSHSSEFGATSLTVTGEDVSVVMDLYEFSLEYPALGPPAIALLILAKYTAIGVIPEVIPTLVDLVTLPLEWVPQQNSSDRAYLQQLAAQHGNVFYVTPGPEPLMNVAYWGPPIRLFNTPKKALSVDMGVATNVQSINFRYDALAPTLMHGLIQDAESELDLPLLTLNSTRLPPLSRNPAVLANQPFVRNNQYTSPKGFTYIEALDNAQSITNLSTDQVVTAQGELDTLRYGEVLSARGLVGVRGAGDTYDGLYYIQSVTHTISRNAYKQQFSISRDGTGSLVSTVQS